MATGTWRNTLLLVLASALTLAATQCPNRCRCQGTEAECSDVPSTLPQTVTKLFLKGYRSVTFEADTFAGLTSVRDLKINLYDSNLNITAHAFRGFKGRKIVITRANVTTLVTNSMSGLHNLSTLSLMHCGVDKIEPRAFEGSSNIQELTLRKNPLTKIAHEAFSGLSNVHNLLLIDSQITTIRSNTFKGLSNVGSLYLSFIPTLKNIEEKAFFGFKSVEKITFEKSAISEIGPRAFEGLGAGNTVKVNFRENKIQTFQCSTFDRMSGPVDFDFTGNPFICDCRMSWVMEETPSRHLSTVMCTSPRRLSSRSFESLTVDDLCNYRRSGKNNGCNDAEKMNPVAYDVSITSQKSRPVKESGDGDSASGLQCSLMLLVISAALNLAS